MKIKKIAVTFIALTSTLLSLNLLASGGEGENKLGQEDKGEVKLTLCDIFPKACGATTSSGNGGGTEPPM